MVRGDALPACDDAGEFRFASSVAPMILSISWGSFLMTPISCRISSAEEIVSFGQLQGSAMRS